jgi:hypothetical protein
MSECSYRSSLAWVSIPDIRINFEKMAIPRAEGSSANISLSGFSGIVAIISKLYHASAIWFCANQIITKEELYTTARTQSIVPAQDGLTGVNVEHVHATLIPIAQRNSDRTARPGAGPSPGLSHIAIRVDGEASSTKTVGEVWVTVKFALDPSSAWAAGRVHRNGIVVVDNPASRVGNQSLVV